MAVRMSLAASLIFAGAASAQVAPAADDLDRVLFSVPDASTRDDTVRRYGYNHFGIACPVTGDKPVIRVGTISGVADPMARFVSNELLGLLPWFDEPASKRLLSSQFNLGTIGPGGVVRSADSFSDYRRLLKNQLDNESARYGMAPDSLAERRPLARFALELCAKRQP